METKTPISLLEQRVQNSGQSAATATLTYLLDKAALFAAQLEGSYDKPLVVVPASMVYFIREALHIRCSDEDLLKHVIQAQKNARVLTGYRLEFRQSGSYQGSQYVGATIVARRVPDSG